MNVPTNKQTIRHELKRQVPISTAIVSSILIQSDLIWFFNTKRHNNEHTCEHCLYGEINDVIDDTLHLI